MPLTQTKSGRNIRAYFNGGVVGLARMKSIKPSISSPTEMVYELGNPNVAEYVPKVKSATLNIDYMVISYGQLAKALGITYGSSTTSGSAPNGVIGEVPPIPSAFDVVEKLIVPGTEHTANEQYYGFTLHQQVIVEKEDWDEEADKVVAVQISARSIPPRRWEGNQGIAFDTFTGDGSTTSFVLAHRSLKNADGYLTVRADIANGQYSLAEGTDYTAASTSSTTTVTFNTAPPVGKITIISAY